MCVCSMPTEARGGGVTGSCELLTIGAGNRTQVVWKSRSQAPSHLTSPKLQLSKCVSQIAAHEGSDTDLP